MSNADLAVVVEFIKRFIGDFEQYGIKNRL